MRITKFCLQLKKNNLLIVISVCFQFGDRFFFKLFYCVTCCLAVW